MACVLRPSRFISRNSCMSLPLSTLGPPPSEDRPAYTLIRGWGIFNRLYEDFCTGADMSVNHRMPRLKLRVGLFTRHWRELLSDYEENLLRRILVDHSQIHADLYCRSRARRRAFVQIVN